MFNNLDASLYNETPHFYEVEFERILTKIYACCILIKEGDYALNNDENKIRDFLLLNFLRKDPVRRELDLLDYHFEREVQEDKSSGRTDIKVITQNTFKVTDAYYILECKRIDNKNTKGTTGLNAEYIKNGICRFTSSYYSSYHRVNGMIGFIVDKLDINSNIEDINTLLSETFPLSNTETKISKDTFIEDFEFHYYSKHMSNKQGMLKIYHLMFDFHDKILPLAN